MGCKHHAKSLACRLLGFAAVKQPLRAHLELADGSREAFLGPIKPAGGNSIKLALGILSNTSL